MRDGVDDLFQGQGVGLRGHELMREEKRMKRLITEESGVLVLFGALTLALIAL